MCQGCVRAMDPDPFLKGNDPGGTGRLRVSVSRVPAVALSSARGSLAHDIAPPSTNGVTSLPGYTFGVQSW